MEWIKSILAKHLKEDGTLDIEAANKEIDSEFPKNAVPKDDFNSKLTELKTANDTINKLQADNKDVEALQTEITGYKSKVADLEAAQELSATRSILEKNLREAGAKDIDYLIYKLGDVKKADDGSIKDLDNKIKDLQANFTDQFEAKGNNSDGFKTIENDLKDGKVSDPDVTAQMISAFTSDIPTTEK